LFLNKTIQQQDYNDNEDSEWLTRYYLRNRFRKILPWYFISISLSYKKARLTI